MAHQCIIKCCNKARLENYEIVVIEIRKLIEEEEEEQEEEEQQEENGEQKIKEYIWREKWLHCLFVNFFDLVYQNTHAHTQRERERERERHAHIYSHTHTHTHTHTHIHIYMYFIPYIPCIYFTLYIISLL